MLSGLEGGVFPWYSHDCRLKSPISCNQTWLAGKSLNWMGAAGKINELNGGLSSPSLMTPILHLEPQIPSLWTNTDVEFTHQFLDHLYFLDFSRFSWLFHVFFLVYPSVNPNQIPRRRNHGFSERRTHLEIPRFTEPRMRKPGDARLLKLRSIFSNGQWCYTMLKNTILYLVLYNQKYFIAISNGVLALWCFVCENYLSWKNLVCKSLSQKQIMWFPSGGLHTYVAALDSELFELELVASTSELLSATSYP